MKISKPENFDRLSLTQKELWKEYYALELEQELLFAEAVGPTASISKWPAVEDPKSGSKSGPAVYVFGRQVTLPPPHEFQHEVDKQRGETKTVYIWLETSSGWAYAGLLVVFKSQTQTQIQELAAARFECGPAQALGLEAASFEEANQIFQLLTKYS